VDLLDLDRRREELDTWRRLLLEGVVSGDCPEVHLLLVFLQDHVVDHFGQEERWMAEAGHPDLGAHKAEHDAFMREYLRYSIEVETKGATPLVTMRVANWLSSWLKGHVAGRDGALAGFLEQWGHRPSGARAASGGAQ
jgi:hemerythrin